MLVYLPITPQAFGLHVFDHEAEILITKPETQNDLPICVSCAFCGYLSERCRLSRPQGHLG